MVSDRFAEVGTVVLGVVAVDELQASAQQLGPTACQRQAETDAAAGVGPGDSYRLR